MTNDYDDNDNPTYDSRKDNAGKSSGMSTLAILGIVFGGLFVVVIVCGGILAVLLMPAVQQARSTSRRSQSKNNLKQIGLALHNYHDTHRVFPSGGVYDVENDINRHSWMTMILPFIDQAPLYTQIRNDDGFHVAWNDEPHESNGTFSTVLPAYLNPRISAGPMTDDGYGAAHYAGNSQLFFRNSSMRIRDITDGTSNTIMGGEVLSGIMAWGNPENIRDPANGVHGSSNGFGSSFQKDGKGGANLLFTDGRVKFISSDIDPETLKRLSLPADGKVVPEY